MTLIKNKKLTLFILACIAGFLLYLWFVFRGTESLVKRPVANIIIGGKFSKVSPEKTTVGELDSRYGKPVGQEKKDNTNTFFYNSSQQYKLDNAWTKDGKVIATKETLPEGMTADELRKELGNPEITLFDTQVIPATWWIYLSKGVAVQIGDDGLVYSLVRFAPQSKEAFIQNIGPVAGITTKKFDETKTIDLP